MLDKRGLSFLKTFGLLLCVQISGYSQSYIVYNADSVERVFNTLPDSIKIKEANNLMRHYLDVDFKKSTYYAEQAFTLEDKVTNKIDVGTTYINWAIAQYNYGKYQESLKYNLKALDIFRTLNDSSKVATAYNNIGITYNALGDYSTAAYYSFQALNIHEPHKNWRKVAVSCLNISSSYYEAKDYRATLKWAGEGFKYYQLAEKPEDFGYALQMFVDAYMALDLIDSAEFFVNKVKELNEKYPNEYLATVNLSQQGGIYAKRKQYDSAITVHQRVINFYKDLEMDDAVLHTRLALARVYIDLKDWKEAQRYAGEAYASSQKIRNKVLIVESSLVLADVLKGRGRLNEALDYTAIASTYKDSIMLNSLRGSIEGRMLDVKLEKETLAKLNAITKLEEQSVLIGKQSLIIIMIAIGLAGMLVITLTVRRVGLFRKKLNNELYKKNERLSDLNNEINGLVNTIVHDLKSPLNSVQGILSVMELTDGSKTEKTELINLAKKSVANGHDIIRQLLELREVEENQSGLKLSEIDAYDLAEEVHNAFQANASQKEIRFSFESVRVKFTSDKVLIHRVLDNLISNALKFSSKDSEVKITVTSESSAVVIRISDEGPGFSTDDLTKIYKKFQKLSARPTGGENSNGLGLATVNLLMKRLGGTMDLNTKPGKGSVFTISFPLRVPEE